MSFLAFSGTGCFHFPQASEALLSALPRTWLNQFEIRAVPRFFSDQGFSPILNFWRDKKIAFVRQSACLVSYEAGFSTDWIDRALSAKQHPGPLSLLGDLHADFFVVRQARDTETFAWKGKHQGDPEPLKTFRRMEEYRLEEEEKPGVISCDDVDWGTYDLVVCLDIPIPTRLIKKTCRTLWAYLSVEGGGPLQEASKKAPVAGYHLFLNHHFRRFRVRPSNAHHMLEFPFSFQSRRVWSRLQEHLGIQAVKRTGVLVDRASSCEMSSGEIPGFEIMGSGGYHFDLAGLTKLYASKKYALRLDRNRRWGNWLPEVVQSGCLFIGRLDSLENRSPLLPGLVVEDFQQARDLIARLEENPCLFMALRELQSAVVEHVAFRRPWADLTDKFKRFFN